MPVPGTDQNDGNNNDDGGDDIASWMAQRQQDVASRDQNAAAGQDAWATSTATGDNLQAAKPSDVASLGADAQGQDAAAKAAAPGVTPDQLAAIIYNETRSLSGPQAQQMREQIAHAVLNADAKWGGKRMTYAHTAPMTAQVPDVEKGTYDASVQSARTAMDQHAKGVDPTNGAVFYQFLPGPSPSVWQNRSMKVQQGPFNNSHPQGNLGPRGVYGDAY